MKSIPLLLQLLWRNKEGIWKTTVHIYLLAKQSVSHLREEYSSYSAMMKGTCVELSTKFPASLSDSAHGKRV